MALQADVFEYLLLILQTDKFKGNMVGGNHDNIVI